jgi:hypothetical protein
LKRFSKISKRNQQNQFNNNNNININIVWVSMIVNNKEINILPRYWKKL